MVEKVVVVDFGSFDSIKKAQAKKASLEKQGFELVKTTQAGLDKFKLKYVKRGK